MKAKEFIPSIKPRNFVAKNQKTAGAGAHKDKKKALKQGDVKHKQKQFEEGVAEGSFGSGYGSVFTLHVNTGEKPTTKTKTKKFKREDDAVLWAEDYADQHEMFPNLKMEIQDENGNVVWELEESQGVAEGTIIAKDDLVDIYIKGKGKNNTPIQKKVGAQIPNSKVNAFIAKVAEKYGLNPKAFVYGPSGDISERFRDSEDEDEGNTEPGNNFAVYINGKKWKVLPGPYGAYADSPEERIEFQRLKDMAQRKSQQTGKKWEVYVTGEPATK